jgi:ADP-ribose pyrophosphatase YjhB (NUDIX family)
MEMKSELAAFLAAYTPGAEEEAAWGAGAMPLQIAAYVSQEHPPLAYVTSARSLVFREESILVLRNADSTHIMPGGRREEGETLEATVGREVLEEAGWAVQSPRLLGFMHFHHLAAQPEDFPYPHPDFIQVVYMTQADTYVPDAKVPEDYEIEARFRPLAQVQALPLTPCERLYLSEALKRRR